MVKFLNTLNPSFQSIDLGDHSIQNRVHSYSMKPVKKDRKLVKYLQKEYMQSKNPNDTCETSLGDLNQKSTIRLLSYFISILQNEYMEFDLDFKALQPKQFNLEKAQIVHQTVNARLHPLISSEPLISNFWKEIDSVMNLKNCSFYSFKPSDGQLDILHPDSLWSKDLFIINLKEKKIIYLSLSAKINPCGDELEMDDMGIDDDGMQWYDEETD